MLSWLLDPAAVYVCGVIVVVVHIHKIYILYNMSRYNSVSVFPPRTQRTGEGREEIGFFSLLRRTYFCISYSCREAQLALNDDWVQKSVNFSR